MSDKYFTESAARALLGRRIRTTVAWAGVPQGCTGTVVRADDEGPGRWTVGIQWDLPAAPPLAAAGAVDGEPFLAIRTGKPLVDWFSRSEYERWIEELSS